jgi:hypothetical protein
VILYQITRYAADDSVIWVRWSDKKQSYHSTRGSMDSFWGAKPGERVTIDELDIPDANIKQIGCYIK